MAINKRFHSPANPWFANAMRSMGLGGISLIKDISPAVYDMGASLNDARKSVADATRKAKSADSRIFMNSIKNNQYMKITNDYFKNAVSDLKSGKFVNNERKDEALEKEMGGFSLDFDDMNLFDEEDGTPTTVNENVIVASDPELMNATFSIRDELVENRNAQIKATKASVDAMVAVTSTSMMEMKGLGTTIISHLSSINNNIGALVEYNSENMTRFIEASIEYYNQTTKKNSESSPSNDKFDVSSIYNSSGALNLKQYKSLLQNRTKTQLGNSEIGFIASMIADNADFFTASPLEFIPKMMLKKALPKNIQNSMTDLGKTVGSFFPTLLNKISDAGEDVNGWGAKSTLMRTAAKFFGVREENKDKFKMDKFEKGAISYDGVSRHAIVEIIPKYLRESTGYLREIATHLTGKDSENIRKDAFNWNTGKYEAEGKLKKDIYDSIKEEIITKFDISDFGEAMGRKKNYLKEDQQGKYQTLLEKLYLSLAESSRNFNHKDLFTGDPLKALIPDIDSDPAVGKYFRASMKSLNSYEAMNINKTRNEARRSKREAIERMENNPYDNNLYLTASDGRISEEILKHPTLSKVAGPKVLSGSASLSVMDYLKDIKFLLNRGINVKIMKGDPFDLAKQSLGGTVTAERELLVSATNEEKTRKRRKTPKLSNASFNAPVSTNNIADMSEDEAIRYIKQMEATSEPTGRGSSTSKTLNRFNNVLYEFAFGSGKGASDELGKIFFEKFQKMGKWVQDKVLLPIKEYFTGRDDGNGYKRNGVFSGMQNGIKDVMNSLRREITGKGYTDSKGNNLDDKSPEDTALGKVKSIFTNIKDSTFTALFGKKGSQEDGTDGEGKKTGIISKAVNSVKEGFSEWRNLIFGKDFNKEDSAEINKKLAESVKEKMPGAIAGTMLGAGAGLLSGGNVGLMGSLFLPGGPIGGAILGTAIGFAAQSKTVRDLLFGKEDNGERVGGLISKKAQDFMKENKDMIVGGAVLGGVKSAVFGSGLFGSLLFGPFTGALLGAGLGIAKKSKAMQDFLYGSGEEGARKGILTSFKEKLNQKDMKNRFGLGVSGALMGGISASVIGQMGLVGAMLTPAGAIGGAILGAGLGIAAASDKFKNYMFGEKDQEGNRSGGMMGRLTDYLGQEVFTPMKLTIKKVAIDANYFLASKILAPIQDAFEPLVFELKQVGTRIKDGFLGLSTKLVDVVKDKVLDPIIENVDKYLVSPMKSVGSKLFNLIFGTIGRILSAPGMLLSGLVNGVVRGQDKRAISAEREEIMARDTHSKGKKGLSWIGGKLADAVSNNFAAGKLAFSKSEQKDAINKRIPYRSEWEANKEERKARRDAEYAKSIGELNAEKAKADDKRKASRESGYRELNIGKSLRQIFSVDKSERQQEATSITDATVEPTANENVRKSAVDGRKIDIKAGGLVFNSKNDSSRTLNSPTLTSEAKAIRINKASDASMETSSKTPKSDTKPSVEMSDNNATQKSSNTAGTKQSSSAAQKEIPRNIRDIRDAVKGQLNGVGANIFRIRKLLEKKLKADDSGDEGSDNNERTSLKDKLGAFFTSGPGNILLAPFRAVSNIAFNIGQTVGTVWDGIKSIPSKIGKGIAKIGNVLKDGAVGIVKTMGDVASGIGTVLLEAGKGVVSVIGTIGKTIVGSVGAVIGGVANVIGSALSGIGTLAGQVANGVSAVIGTLPAIAEGVGTLLGGVVKSVGQVGKVLIDGVTTVATGALKVVKEAASVIGQAILAPFKLVSGLVGNLFGAVTGRSKTTKTQLMRGGYLDRINEPVKVINDGSKALHVIVDKALTPLEVSFDDDRKSDNDISKSRDPKKLTINERMLGVLLDIKNFISGTSKGKTYSGPRATRLNKSVVGYRPTEEAELSPIESVDDTTVADTTNQGFLSRMGSAFKKGASDYWNQSQMVYFMPPELNMLDDAAKKIKSGVTNSKLYQKFFGNRAANKDAQQDAARDAEFKAESTKNYEDANNRTADYQRNVAELNSEKLKAADKENTQLQLMKSIAKDTHEHSTGWLGMFGKKGIIGAALIAGIPILFKVVKSLFNGEFLDNLKSWGSQFINDIITGASDVGGLAGMAKNAGGVMSDIGAVFGIGDKAYNEDGTKKNFVQRLGNWIMPGGNHDAMTDSKVNFLRGRATNAAKTTKKGIAAGKKILETGKNVFNAVKDSKIGQTMSSIFKKKTVSTVTSDVVNDTVQNVFTNSNAAVLADVGSEVSSPITRTIETTGKKADIWWDTAKSTASEGAESAAKSAGKKTVVETVQDVAKASVSTASKAGDELLEAAKGSKATTILTWVKKAFKTIVEFVTDFAKKHKLKGIDKVITSLSKSEGKFTTKLISKNLGRFAKPLAKVATAAGTALASDVLWAAIGAVDGATSAANLFRLNSSKDVDGKMILISTLIKGLLGTSVGSWIDIINEIITEITGTDFIHELACLIYSIFATKEEEDALNNSKNEARSRYESEVEDTYLAAYADYQNQAGAGAADYETWKKDANVDVKSYNDWNDEQNLTLGGRISKGMKTIGNGIGKAASTAWGGIKTAASATWNGIKNAGGFIANTSKKLWDMTPIGGALGGFTNEEQIKKNLGITGDGKVTMGMRASSGLAEGIENATFGLLNSEKTTKIIYSIGLKVSDFFTGIKDTAGKIWDGAKDLAGKGFSYIKDEIIGKNIETIKAGATVAWNGAKDIAGKGFNFLKDKIIGPNVETIKTGATVAWNGAKDLAGKGFNFLKDKVIGPNVEMLKTGASAAWEGISTIASKGWNAAKTVVSDNLATIKTGADTILKTIGGVFKTAFDGVSSVVTKIADTIGGFFGNIFGTVTNFLGLGDKEGKDGSLPSNIVSGAKETVKNTLGWLSNIFSGNRAEDELSKNGWTTGGGLGFGPSMTMMTDGGSKSTASSNTTSQPVDYTNTSDLYQNFAYYSQKDNRWKSKPYYTGKTIGSAGCGPTSMAMVSTSLIGKRYYPDELTTKSLGWGTYKEGSGTTAGFFEKAAKEYGLNYTEYSGASLNQDYIKSTIDKGQPLILSGNNKNQSTSASPFTEGGHLVVAHGYTNGGNGLIINDPRGIEYSKVYSTSDVLKGAKYGFSFKNSGATHPTPAGGDGNPFPVFGVDIPYSKDQLVNGNYNAGLSSTSGGKSSGGIFNILSSFFTGIGDAIFNGLLSGDYSVNWAEVFGETTGSSDATYQQMPTTLEDELAAKIFELTQRSEGDYNSVNPNDAGSYSVGAMQFHGAKAKEFFTRLSTQLTDPADVQKAIEYANRAGTSLTSTEASEMTAFLNKPSVNAVNQQVQYQYAMDLIKGENMAEAVDMFKAGILKDPRSIVLIGDIANTGPGHVADWRKTYVPVSNASMELSAVSQSLQSPASYWGNYMKQDGRYTDGWKKRIQNTYQTLSGWTPSFTDTSSLGLGFGDSTFSLRELLHPESSCNQGLGFGETRFVPNAEFKRVRILDKYERNNGKGLGLGSVPRTSVTRTSNSSDALSKAYYRLQTAKTGGADNVTIEKLIQTIIGLLEGISKHTLSTSEKMDLLKSLGSTSSTPVAEASKNVVVVPQSKSNDKGSAMSLNESIARRIAMGKA